MLFPKRKKDMVDIRELQKRGVVRIPKGNINIPTSADGFVELGQVKDQAAETTRATTSNADFFGFMGDTAPTSSEPQSFSTESEGYNKREVDTKISDLDNKIYKLEQRIELLEKKLEVNQSNNTGTMGW